MGVIFAGVLNGRWFNSDYAFEIVTLK